MRPRRRARVDLVEIRAERQPRDILGFPLRVALGVATDLSHGALECRPHVGTARLSRPERLAVMVAMFEDRVPRTQTNPGHFRVVPNSGLPRCDPAAPELEEIAV